MKEILNFKAHLLDSYKSEKTINAYVNDVVQFVNYFRDKSLNDITNSDIELYKNYLLNVQYLSPTTTNRKLVAIGQFLTYNQITVTIKQVKIHTQNFLDDIFESSDIENIINITEERNDLRAKALIMTLQLTGMRISEALQLTVDDIYKDTIMIIGKGNKRRNVFIPKRLGEVWREYYKIRINKTNMLFTGQKGALTRFTAHKILKKYATMARVDLKKAHCHNLRHFYIKKLVSKGLNIDEVADLAGHVNINTTRIYTRKSKQELLDIINDI